MSEKEQQLEDYLYLLHHIEIGPNDEEIIHHCKTYDHIANMFAIEHLVVKDKVYHIISGLEPTQEVAWSDEEAEENKIKPKKMVDGMTYKQKSKEW